MEAHFSCEKVTGGWIVNVLTEEADGNKSETSVVVNDSKLVKQFREFVKSVNNSPDDADA